MDTRTVFALRRDGKIREALDMALKLYKIDPEDSWTQNALAWPLIDMCKAALIQDNRNQAQHFFNQLIAINFTDIDEIIKSQIALLKPKIDVNYVKIQEAENLSKNGNHKQALQNMKAMFANHELLDIHHEAYSWIIYRYIKAEENNVSSIEVRSLMRDYMNLENERPSMVHSVFLNFALTFSQKNNDFNLYNFFLLWNPKYLRPEDVNKNHKDGKVFPSLLSRIFREFIEKSAPINCNNLKEHIKIISTTQVIENLRKPYFWKIYLADKEAQNEELLKLFNEYNIIFAEQMSSETNSKILNSAIQFSKKYSNFDLYDFFILWNPKNLRLEDFCKNTKEEKTFPSLFSKLVKEFIEKKVSFDCDSLLEKMPFLPAVDFLDIMREPFYSQIYRANKENKNHKLWQLFDEYNLFFKGKRGSQTHSKILNSALFSMVESEEWRFLSFFENWNPKNFTENDWKEVNKDDKVYKPLAIKALKKAFDATKAGKEFQDKELLIDGYKTALLKYPKDNWIKREYALLLFKIGKEIDAIKIYRNLVLELGDQSYIWHEFSQFLGETEINLSIGMLSKAIRLQKDESFLGDIRLELASKLISLDQLEEACIELTIYARNRDLKGWKKSERYKELSLLLNNVTSQKLDNNSLYKEKITLAENFAYHDIKWTDMVLAEKWINDKNKEKLNFTNGDLINFPVSTSRFLTLRNASLGDVYKFKLHNKLVPDKVKLHHFNQQYTPLIAQKSEKPKWSSLGQVALYIDYINNDKNIVHAITPENREVFFPKANVELFSGNFATARFFKKKIRDDERIELRDISKANKNDVVAKFSSYLAVVDSVNQERKLFHYVVNTMIHGIVRYDDTEIRPDEGDFISLRLIKKLDKKFNKIIYKQIDVQTTVDTSSTLKKEISGKLKLKYKQNGLTIDWVDLNSVDDNNPQPDFAFIEDYYVSKEVLLKNKFTPQTNVEAVVILSGDKWKVINFREIETYD